MHFVEDTACGRLATATRGAVATKDIMTQIDRAADGIKIANTVA